MNTPQKPRVGLALGSGSARGWAHVGVIRALEQAGIRPDVVCGTSIGALVGAAYAAGELDHLEQWLDSLLMKDKAIVFSFHDYPWLIHRLGHINRRRRCVTTREANDETVESARCQ